MSSRPYLDPLSVNASAKDLFSDPAAGMAPSTYRMSLQAIEQLGDHTYQHPNYLSKAAKQTGPLGSVRSPDSFPLPEYLRFNSYLPWKQRFMWPGETGLFRNAAQDSKQKAVTSDRTCCILSGIVFAGLVLALIIALQ